jgi:hypothetical protein
MLCRDLVVMTSLSCRDLVVTTSLSCKDLVVTTSLSCKDLLLEPIFETLRDIPVEFRNGEFLVNGRDYAHVGPGAQSDAAEGTRNIYVLLTKHKSVTAMLLRFFTWSEYTHSSIALERDGSHYSFNPVRGFTIERPIHKKRGATPCMLYRVQVTESVYADIESRIKWFVENPDEYKFNYVGLVLMILRIPVGIGNRYFCSQFVSDLLTSSDAAKLRKKSTKYLPRHFSRENSFTLAFNGEAADFKENNLRQGGII